MPDRKQESYAVRLEAAELARSRNHPQHEANGDEQKYASALYFMSFTKGLPHNPHTGLLQDPQDFVEYRRAIDDGFIDAFSQVRHGAKHEIDESGKVQPINFDDKGGEAKADIAKDFRQWEAPTAGVTYELQGPDAQAVTMPPAPPLIGSDGQANPELVLEMAEVYELAILRDIPFNYFEGEAVANDPSSEAIRKSFERLNTLEYISENVDGKQPGRPRKVNSQGKLDFQTVFRGSSPGVDVGPYLSQFLLIGNADVNGGGSVAEGKITYGVLQTDQKVPIACPADDYMKTLEAYAQVQQGIRPDPEGYVPDGNRLARRFISTPRDLATYVHYDALYEAYLNACIILLGMGTPFDPSFDHLSGVGAAAGNLETRRNAGGFALYGGPHILTLVTEVATRALKAVRFQKFNNHIRLRPEALAARIELARKGEDSLVPDTLIADVGKLRKKLDDNGTLGALSNISKTDNNLLPMAFPEGSPMHPAYGAGHATVAGACVTILKAFFDTSAVLVKRTSTDSRTNEVKTEIKFDRLNPKLDSGIIFRTPDYPELIQDPSKPKEYNPKALEEYKETVLKETVLPATPTETFLTLEGELNKLAANISIGRDMAGVHYFSDYYDSLRMGEEIAIGILKEQALTYTTDPCVMSIPTFDGKVVRIGAR